MAVAVVGAVLLSAGMISAPSARSLGGDAVDGWAILAEKDDYSDIVSTDEWDLPVDYIGSVFTHYFAAAFGNPKADTDVDGLVSVQEAASLAEAQQRAYMHDVVLTVPRFVEIFHRAGLSPEKDPAYPHVVVDDAIGEPLYLALKAYQ